MILKWLHSQPVAIACSVCEQAVRENEILSRVSYRILSWGGGKHGGSTMIVRSVRKHAHACAPGHAPPGKF